MSDVTRRIANFSPEKLKLLVQETQKKGHKHSAQEIQPQKRSSTSFPLSFAQQRLWFLDQLEPDTSLYTIPIAIRLRGVLDVQTLEQALNEIVRRHEILRTGFVILDGQPMQEVVASLSITLPVVDMSALPSSRQELLIEPLLQEAVQRPFNLAQLPLMRVHLLRLRTTEHVLLLTLHHIVSDGWSISILAHELSALYQTFLSGQTSSLPQLSIQYVDYTLWQQNLLQGEVLEQQLAYWKQQLQSAPTVLDLPTDHPRPAIQTFRGARHLLRLPLTLTRALKELSHKEGVTLFMTLLTTFAALLARYSSHYDFIIGTPTANRTRTQLEGLIGCFVNTLALRVDMTDDPSVQALLKRVRELCLEGYAHQDIPFEKVVEALQPERTLSHTPLFQVLFNLQNVATPLLEAAGLQFELRGVERSTAKFDLDLFMQETPDGLAGVLAYNSDLFESTTIERMAGHYQTMLTAITTDCQQPISRLPLLTALERQQVLFKWNETQADVPTESGLHQLFEAQAARTPDAIAVVYEDAQLTYDELNRGANRIARHLRLRGAGPEIRVGLCFYRSPEMLIALLGILKAGGAYVPLDPNTPGERLAYLAHHAQLQLLLTQVELQPYLQTHLPAVRTILLMPEQADLSNNEQADLNPEVNFSANNLAYLVYTSGSTGRPKGVLCTHGGAVNYLSALLQLYPLKANMTVLQLPHLSFDASVRDIFGTLLVGGRLILLPSEDARDLSAMLLLMRQHQVTHILSIVPSFLRILLDTAQALTITLPSLQLLLSSGERLPLSIVSRARHLLAEHLEVVNQYGPTETTMTALYYRLPMESQLYESGLEYALSGRPIPYMQVYLLDQWYQPVPPGIAAEVYLGGAGVTRGYLGQADETAMRFVPHPFSTRHGDRLYRTGDLARYRSDGAVEYLGRLDQQVKIRGNRVEPAEIERLLENYAEIKQAIVLASQDDTSDSVLIAYMLAEPGQTIPGPKVLRTFLLAYVPEYMLPAYFIVLDTLPLTPNGKLDRRRLPAPEESRVEAEGTCTAPRSPLEEMLVAIWSAVLRRETVSIYANFFELGGHSLLATQVILRLRDLLQRAFPLRTIFEAPTIASLAQRLTSSTQEELGLTFPPLLPRANQEPVPLSFAQQRLWFLEQMEPGNASYNIAASLRMQGTLNIAALEACFNTILSRHESLRTIFLLHRGEPVQRILPSLTLSLPLIDLSALPPTRLDIVLQQLASQEGEAPFQLAQGPLLRVTLLRLDAQEHVLLLSMHHIISDGWSLGVFQRELSLLYTGCCSHSPSHPSPLSPLSIQYPDYALWQRQWPFLERQRAFWLEQLQNAPLVLNLPTDFPRPPVLSSQGARQYFTLPASLSQHLTTFSQQQGVTLFMTLLTAWSLLLSRYSDQDDLLIGTPIANRSHADLETLIGCFVNTLVLRADLTGNPSLHELLTRIRQRCLDAYAQQDFPFERLVEALHPQRDLSHSPLFQAFFILQNTPVEPLTLPDLHLTPLPIARTTARFELSLNIQPSPAGLLGILEYNRDLFAPSTIAAMISQFQTLLATMVATPHLPISELPLLSQEERLHLLKLATAPIPDEPVDTRSLLERLAVQVQRFPDAIAVVFEDEQITYQELDQRTTHLAHLLQTQGVGPEVLVGLCLERSPLLLIGLLAILKAGGAFVPLDPATPPARLQQILQQSDTHFLLSIPTLAPLCASLSTALPDLALLWLPELLQQSLSAPAPLPLPLPQSLFCVLFTSGSTGYPKGVMLSHAGVLNHLSAKIEALHLSPADTLAQTASQSFVVSLWQFLAPLLSGARLLILPTPTVQDPSLLLTLLALTRVSVLELVPSLLRVLLDLPSTHPDAPLPLPALRWLILTGEALPPELVQRLRQRAPTLNLLNAYGPTEASDDVAHALLPVHAETLEHSTPIGRPIVNIRLLILDRFGQLTLPGVPGFLHIAGLGLSRGYLTDPAQTAEVFLPDPFSSLPGTRLYRTGDLARWRPDGQLEYLGRADQQVKVRGVRLELGEIESFLRQHPAIQDAAARLWQPPDGPSQLLAYLVWRSQPATASLSEIRLFLQERLPEAMLPERFLTLRRLPLNANGKLDRQSLPTPESIELQSNEDYAAPRSPLEEMLVNIWSAVLRRETVGIYDNFFELGGHSLLATQVISRIQELLQRALPLRAIFEAPTIASLAQRLTSTTQEELGLTFPPLLPHNHQEPVPLSFAQQRLWLLDQIEPDNTSYTIAAALRMQGTLNIAALEECFNIILRRHESLRTIFPNRDGIPVQQVLPSLMLSLPLIDLSLLPAAQQDALPEQLASQEGETPFSLAQGPLFRAYVVRLHAQEHILLLSMHHIVSDGWSLGVFQRELSLFYPACCSHKASPLSPLPIQYSDYALWQRPWPSLERQRAFLLEQLQDAPLVLSLPTDFPRPPVLSSQGARLYFTLPTSLSQQLTTFSQQQGVTLFMTLLTAWSLLLARYSDQDDLLIGTPIANRTHADLEALIGCFVNTLVLRTDLTGNPSLHELLTRIRQRCLDAYAQQDFPFERLVEALHPQRDLSHSPLFQAFFILQNAPIEPLALPDLRLTPLPIARTTARFELSLSMQPAPTGLLGLLEYNRDLFSPSTIAAMASQLQTLLTAMVTSPHLSISELPLLSQEERLRMLHLASGPQQPFPEHLSLPQLFEAQVQRRPDAIAFVCEDKQFTYQELNQQATRLARLLQTQGVGPEVLVGLCLERTPLLLIGLLAILKAGGAFVPLDPSYPGERLAFLLKDAGVQVLLTQHDCLTIFPEYQGRLLCLDDDWSSSAEYRSDPLPTPTQPENLAYVIYTSGSTGQPKGVQITHRAVINFLHAMSQQLQLTEHEKLLAVTSLSFDIAVLELFLPLTVGAQLTLVSRKTAIDGTQLIKHQIESGATIMQATPATWRLFIQAGLPHHRPLKILCGGEALPDDLARQLLAKEKTIWNLYGPTETTIWSSIQRLDDNKQSITLGSPLANTQMYILDRRLQPVPVGVAGELYIGGEGVARGYLDRFDLTAERFIPDPFSGVSGGRLYKTGDLTRYLPDGTIDFLGRLDHQVKLRGHRIEPGEIETVLATHPMVREAVVILREDLPGNMRLVAYVVSHPQQNSPISTLRTYLQTRLPDYMRPATYVMMDKLPLTPNGKLDRRMLPAPPALDDTRQEAEETYVEPRNPIDELLLGIWSEVLHITRIGIYDDFFELGGHSLLATQVISRVRETFKEVLPVNTLFQTPTIAGLAEALVRHETVKGRVATIANLRKKIGTMSADERREALRNKTKEKDHNDG